MIHCPPLINRDLDFSGVGNKLLFVVFPILEAPLKLAGGFPDVELRSLRDEP